MRVEVIERALAEEDRVRQRAVPGRELERAAPGVGHRGGQVRGLDRVQPVRPGQLHVVAVDSGRGREGRQRQRPVGAADPDVFVELEVPRGARERREGVDEDAVRTGGGKVDRLRDPPARADRRVAVDDHAEVVADDDQVHPGVRAGAAPVGRERLAGRLTDREREPSRAGMGDRARPEPGQREGPRVVNRRHVRPRRRAAGRDERQQAQTEAAAHEPAG